MNKYLDLTEILKECPKGTELYSPIFGNVYLNKIRPYLAIVVTINKEQDNFTEEFLYDGRYGINGECILFPSKDQRDWSKWHRPFTDGDILTYMFYGKPTIYIYRESGTHNTSYYAAYSSENNKFYGDGKGALAGNRPDLRFATEEEKQKLFKVLEDNGYRWNAETKTLEKLKKEKFDFKTLQPFDKVLVRDFNTQNWMACLFSHIDNNFHHKFRTVDRAGWYHCIPFNDDTKHLVGKSDEAPEFYRYWEE